MWKWDVYVPIQLFTLKEDALIWKKICKGNQFLCIILMTKYMGKKTARKYVCAFNVFMIECPLTVFINELKI